MLEKINQEILGKPVIAIAGPSAIGKNDLALDLARQLNAYVVNADSRQVYKELPIATAMPIADKIENDHWVISGVEHWLYGHKSIFDNYTLYDYQKDAFILMNQKIGQKAIFVGGTGLYIDSVLLNYKLRKEVLKNSFTDLSVADMQEKLGDKVSLLNNSDRNNPHRLSRLLSRTGMKYNKGKSLDHAYIILIPKSLPWLYERIRLRIDIMFEQGLENEYKNVKQMIKDTGRQMFPSKTIGFAEFEQGLLTTSEIKEQIFLNTCKYVKRQLTWFKKVKSDQYFFIEV